MFSHLELFASKNEICHIVQVLHAFSRDSIVRVRAGWCGWQLWATRRHSVIDATLACIMSLLRLHTVCHMVFTYSAWDRQPSSSQPHELHIKWTTYCLTLIDSTMSALGRSLCRLAVCHIQFIMPAEKRRRVPRSCPCSCALPANDLPLEFSAFM